MAEPTTNPTATVHPPEPVTPPAPAPVVTTPTAPPATASTATPAPPDPDEPFDKDRAMALITKLREEVKDAKAAGKEAGELKRRLDEIEAAQLTEQQKLERRAEEAEARLAAADLRVRTANLVSELSKPEHGIVNAQAAAKLLDGVEFDDTGNPSNLTDLLPPFLESNAFLKGAYTPPPAPNVNPGAGAAPGPPPALTADELEAAKAMNMTAEEYVAFKPTGGRTSVSIEDFRAIEKSSAGSTTP